MKILKAILLVPALLALLAGTALGKSAPKHARLDPSFGRDGIATVAAPRAEAQIQSFVVARDGRVYVLRGANVFAFEADGEVARGFGKNGRITVAPAVGQGEPRDLAVDTEGRILVTGSTYMGSQVWTGPPPWAGAVQYSELSNGYVIRFLPDGSRDVTFGSDGEVDTDFGLPRAGAAPERPTVQATAIAVDAQDRAIIGGDFVQTTDPCAAYLHGTLAPFVARLTPSGALDTTFAGKGFSLPGGKGEVTALAHTPGGGAATLSRGSSCGPRTDEEPSHFTAFDEAGEAIPSLDPSRPAFYMTPAMAIDPDGRVLVIQVPSLFSSGPRVLVRLLPNGDVDTGFGQNGGVAMTAGLGSVRAAFTVDSKSRPILAGGKDRIELRRLDANGKIDRSFGPKGRLTAKGGAPEAVTLDGRGRIYTASLVKNAKLKTGTGLGVARFLPGN